MERHKNHVKYKNGKRSRKSAPDIISRVLHKKYARKSQPTLVAIGGPGGTGKSTFALELEKSLKNAVVLKLDDYKTDREHRSTRGISGPHPDANRTSLINQHLKQLKNRQTVDRPVYNRNRGRADSYTTFSPENFIIIDGEISTYSQFKNHIDFSIFIDADWKTQLETRLSRDMESRGYSLEKAIDTYLKSNIREFNKYGAHNKKWADIHLYCRKDYSLIIESIDEELYTKYKDIFEEEFSVLEISGLITALCTPFDSKNRIDEQALIAHLEFLARNGSRRLLINGTTGEFFSLTPQERKLVLSLSRRYFPGVVIFHAGCTSLKETTEELRWAENYGADAAAALPPYYIADAPSEGIAGYFNQLAKATQLPLILYNFPKHTQNSITPEIAESVKHFGIKDSSADFSLVDHTDNYFIGSDRDLAGSYNAGAKGFVSARSNLFPDIYSQMENALKNNDRVNCKKIQNTIREIRDILSGPHQIYIIKHFLSKVIKDYPENVRLPLINTVKLDKKKEKRILSALHTN